jgi:signal transduction histidine kinase
VVVEPGVGRVEVTVSDTGVGMSADELRQAFDKFYRAEYARDQAVQGVGLGLPAARAIADAHGGSVTLRSTPARAGAPGATVATLVLPLEPSVITSR